MHPHYSLSSSPIGPLFPYALDRTAFRRRQDRNTAETPAGARDAEGETKTGWEARRPFLHVHGGSHFLPHTCTGDHGGPRWHSAQSAGDQEPPAGQEGRQVPVGVETGAIMPVYRLMLVAPAWRG